MKKRSKSKKPIKSKAKSQKSTFADRLPKNHGEWLELVIKLTDRVIVDGRPDYMVAQKNRLEAELKKWKSENS